MMETVLTEEEQQMRRAERESMISFDQEHTTRYNLEFRPDAEMLQHGATHLKCYHCDESPTWYFFPTAGVVRVVCNHHKGMYTTKLLFPLFVENVCPICDNDPTYCIFPCGHSICAECYAKHLSATLQENTSQSRSSCPFCKLEFTRKDVIGIVNRH